MAWADDTRPPEAELQLEREAEGLYLSVRHSLSLAPAVEDALYKAVPLYFVYQADVLRARWYWTDKRITSATRTLRLAYQPLTRRWRLSIASGASAGASGMQYALHLSFDTLSEAVGAVGRVARWKIADAGALEDDERYRVDFRFRLDLSLLPRPFQIGMGNQPEWNVERAQRLEVPPVTP